MSALTTRHQATNVVRSDNMKHITQNDGRYNYDRGLSQLFHIELYWLNVPEQVTCSFSALTLLVGSFDL